MAQHDVALPKICPFDPNLKFVPFVLLAAGILGGGLLGFGRITGIPMREPTLDFLVLVVFLHEVHTAVTFLLLAFIPEGRSVAREVLGRSAWSLLALTGLFCLFFCEGVFRNFGEWIRPDTEKWLAAIFIFFKGQHAITQCKGISYQYAYLARSRFHSDSRMLERLNAFERRERVLFPFAIWTLVLHLIVYYWKVLPEGHIAAARVLAFVEFGLVTLIVINAWLGPDSKVSTKRYYLLTLFAYPFVSYSEFALSFVAAVHGVEYGLISIGMLQRSSWEKSRTAVGAFALLFAFVVLMVCASVFQPLFPVTALFRRFGACLGVSLFVINYMHYYVDRFFFQFRDPIVAKTIGPLMASEAVA